MDFDAMLGAFDEKFSEAQKRHIHQDILSMAKAFDLSNMDQAVYFGSQFVCAARAAGLSRGMTGAFLRKIQSAYDDENQKT